MTPTLEDLQAELETVRRGLDQARFDLSDANDEVERLGSALAVAESERDALKAELELTNPIMTAALIKAIEKEKDAALAKVEAMKCDFLEAQGLEEDIFHLRKRLEAAESERDALKKALDAVWAYEESVQRDIKARGEVSDGTMHLQLLATDLRKAALSDAPAPEAKVERVTQADFDALAERVRDGERGSKRVAEIERELFPMDAQCPRCDGYRKALTEISNALECEYPCDWTEKRCPACDHNSGHGWCAGCVARAALSPREAK